MTQAKGAASHPKHQHSSTEMTIRPDEAEGPSPFAALRALVARHIEGLEKLQEEFAADPSPANHERFAKSLSTLIKSAAQLFAADATPRKSADELKREDDAIRDEFAGRLAAMLRARGPGLAAPANAAPAAPEASS